MKKNGFTLVELLAVIAILAILVIIALPNVMNMFNNAKKSNFETEVKQIYKMSITQWMSDNITSSSEIIYSKCEDGCENSLKNLDARNSLNYYVKVNNSGKVTQLYVTDGTFQYKYDGNDLKTEEIKDIETIAEVEKEKEIIIKPSNAYFKTGSEVNVFMKILAGNNNPTISTGDTHIISFSRKNNIPNEYKTDDYIISTSNSNYPIYMWYEKEDENKGKIYWFSEANNVYTNEDASHMFRLLQGNKNLDITGINSSKSKNMRYMFAANTELESLNLSNFKTNSATDMFAMFQSMAKLTSLDLRSFDTSKVTTMNRMFSYSEKLESINLSSFNTSNVTDMNTMFRNCGSLKKLDLRNFNTSKVTDMMYLFCHDVSLTELNVSTWDVSKVKNMGFTFYNCPKLTTIDLSNWHTTSLTDMFRTFYGCSGVTDLRLDNFDTSNVTRMTTAFLGLKNIKTLDLSSFDTSKVELTSQMFYGDSILETIYVSEKFNMSSVTSSANMFGACPKLKGQNGTTYNSKKVSVLYAKIDTPSTPGYLTLKK